MLFTVCFALGVLLLLFLRWPSSQFNQSATTAAVLLCIVLGVYAYAVWNWGHFRLRRDDRAADNLYYLGFIFTVCALGISLYRFSVADDARIANIVGDLGVGISTTVLGLFLRVLFLQREDPADVEDRVQRELIDVAEATVTRIRETAAIVEQGQILTRQTIDELNETTLKCSSEFTARMKELDQRLRDVEIPPDLIFSRLDPVLNEASQSIAGFVNRVNRVEVPAQLISERLDHAFTGIKESAPILFDKTILDLHKALVDALEKLRSQAENAVTVICQDLASRMAELELPTREIDLRTNKMLDRLDESSDHLVTGMQRMGSAVSEAERAMLMSPTAVSQSLDSLRAKMTELFDQVERRVDTFGSKLAALDTENIARALVAVDAFVEESREALSAQSAVTIEQTSLLKDVSIHLQKFNASVPEILTSLEVLGNKLTDESFRAGGNSEQSSRLWRRWPFNQ